MLSFTVDHLAPDLITQRFVALVNRLLPQGWRFSIAPLPRLVPGGDGFDHARSSARSYRLQSGYGRLTRWDQVGTGKAQDDAWRHRFCEALSRLAGPGPVSAFELADPNDVRSNQMFRDASVLAILDVDDFEQSLPIDAARSLIHRLEVSPLGETMPRPEVIPARHALPYSG